MTHRSAQIIVASALRAVAAARVAVGYFYFGYWFSQRRAWYPTGAL